MPPPFSSHLKPLIESSSKGTTNIFELSDRIIVVIQ